MNVEPYVEWQQIKYNRFAYRRVELILFILTSSWLFIGGKMEYMQQQPRATPEYNKKSRYIFNEMRMSAQKRDQMIFTAEQYQSKFVVIKLV